jgi:hypothetical protein
MAYLMAPIPYLRCLVRREFTRNRQDRHGEYIPAVAYGIRCVRGESLWFQCMLMEPEDGSPNNTGGASFLLPIEALCTRSCDPPADLGYVQPWDTFSSDFGICEFAFLGAAYILPARVPAQYRFTIDFTGTDLADDAEQHKCLHVCELETGLIGAFPNNRVLWRDDAFWKLMDQQPDFVSLNGEFRAEGWPPSSNPRNNPMTANYGPRKAADTKKPAAKAGMKPAPKPAAKGGRKKGY